MVLLMRNNGDGSNVVDITRWQSGGAIELNASMGTHVRVGQCWRLEIRKTVTTWRICKCSTGSVECSAIESV